LPDWGLKKVSSWKTADNSLFRGLGSLQADSRLPHVAGRETGRRPVVVLAHDVAARRGTIGGERRTVRIVLDTDIDDAVERNAMPGQTVITGDSRPGFCWASAGTEAVKAPTKSSPSIRTLECGKDD